MKQTLLWTGAAAVALGAGAPVILPSLPSSIQTSAIFTSSGSFLIDYGNWIALFGLVLMLAAVLA